MAWSVEIPFPISSIIHTAHHMTESARLMMEQNTVDYKTIANMTARQRLLRVFGKKGYISWKLSQFVG